MKILDLYFNLNKKSNYTDNILKTDVQHPLLDILIQEIKDSTS